MPRSNLPLIASVFAICLSATSAAAADPVAPQIVPQCRTYALADGRTVCGYVVALADGTEQLDQWRDVLRADAELAELRVAVDLQRRRAAELAAAVVDVSSAVEACRLARAVYERRVGELTDYALERDRLYQEERIKPRIGGRWGWYAAGAVALAFGGYVAFDKLGDE